MPLLSWHIRRDGQSTWRPIAVPGCWEDAGFPADDPGPYWYRTELTVPALAVGQRLWLRFGAVSYHCTIFVDGQEAGQHTGMWDAFEVEITHAVRARCAGEDAELLVCVEKPASLTAGPDSPPVPGRFPLRQTLSGFLPYVWGHAFGGLWQGVDLAVTGPRRLGDLQVGGTADGQVGIVGECSAPGPVVVAVHNPAGRLVVQETVQAVPQFEWSASLPHPRPWSPGRPALYTAYLQLPDGDERRLRFGLRTVETRGASLRLNRRPIYPRLALSWGWYPDRRCPDPGPQRVRDDLLRLRTMGYNGVKLCLWFPPPYYFDLADELGLILWLELPMWLPEPASDFYRQVPLEYGRLVRAASSHPSLLLVTLGCELNRSVEATFLAGLYTQTKALAGGALVRDNSGSGEAYGGWLDESADFYDHHFYCEAQFIRPLLDAFAPAWREAKPWFMGEFCDHDTLRDLPALLRAGEGALPWWMSAEPQVNPQGARWEMRATGHLEALRRSGLWERSNQLIQASYRQASLHRKVTLEMVRARPELSGYVVTGEADTPVSSAGMWDDLGRVKFDPAAFRAFNDDVVLLLGPARRRAWVTGGDRPAFWDPYNYRAGETVRAHLLLSHYGSFRGRARLAWQVNLLGHGTLSAGEAVVKPGPGRVQEVALAEFRAPEIARPSRMLLQAQLEAGGRTYANAWPLWVYPIDPWAGVPPFGLIDTLGGLGDLPGVARGFCTVYPAEGNLPDHDAVLVCTAWTRALDAWVRAGGRAVLLQQGGGSPGPLPVAECPYWREALKWVEPHPAWGDFPHDEDPGLQFYGLAPDCALDTSGLAEMASPLLRRLDTRSLAVHEYAVALAWGFGELLVTTLRLQGGLGDQATGISRNPAAACLLAGWLRYLAGL